MNHTLFDQQLELIILEQIELVSDCDLWGLQELS